MQIVNNNGYGNNALEQTNRAAETSPANSSGSPAASSANTTPTDGLQLSSFAGTLSSVLKSDSTGRAERVAQLASAVQAGTYQVDPMAVSRAMVDHAISAGASLS